MPSINFSTVKLPNFGEPVPAGTYNVVVEEANVKESKNGDEMLELVLSIVDSDEFNNRKVWHYFTFGSEQAVEISSSYLKSLLIGAGWTDDDLEQPIDPLTEEFCDSIRGSTVGVKVGVKAGQGDFGPQNNVKAYTTPA